MKVAFIVDASVADTKKVKKENVFVIPFLAYDKKGNLTKVYDKKVINEIQLKETENKNYIEPTPGMYRDLYKEVLSSGYDYIVTIPQSKTYSKSYVNANYMSEIGFNEIMVIDVTEYNLSAESVFKHAIDEQYHEEVLTMNIDLETLVSMIKGLLSKLGTVVA